MTSVLPGASDATFSLHTSYTEMPRAWASCFSSQQKLFTNHSRLVADVALPSRVNHMPGTANREHQKETFVDDGIVGDDLVDAPGARDDAEDAVVDDPGADAQRHRCRTGRRRPACPRPAR